MNCPSVNITRRGFQLEFYSLGRSETQVWVSWKSFLRPLLTPHPLHPPAPKWEPLLQATPFIKLCPHRTCQCLKKVLVLSGWDLAFSGLSWIFPELLKQHHLRQHHKRVKVCEVPGFSEFTVSLSSMVNGNKSHLWYCSPLPSPRLYPFL